MGQTYPCPPCRGGNGYLYAGRGCLLDVADEEFGDFLVILVGNQPAGDLGKGLRREDRFGPFADVSAPDAANVESGADGGPFERVVSAFSLQGVYSYGFPVGRLVVGDGGNHRPFFG